MANFDLGRFFGRSFFEFDFLSYDKVSLVAAEAYKLKRASLGDSFAF
jgi:hypothetical protein